jgi:hypothetical protein
MKSVKLVGAAAMILTASCAVQVSTDGSGNAPSSAPRSQARRSAPPPPRPSPPPPRPSPNAPPPSPGPTVVQAVAPTPAPAINVKVVQDIKARNPKACGYVEVSPDNWVHVDCNKYAASAQAVTHLSGRKLRIVNAHKQVFKPLRSQQWRLYKLRGRGGSTPAPAAGAGPAMGGPDQVAEPFPPTVDHRADNTEGPVKNQGGVGSCTAHSLSTALDNAAIRAGNLKPNDRNAMTSPLHVWSRYGLPDMGAAADGNVAQPIGTYQLWPQNDKEACMMFQPGGGYAEDCAQAYGVKPGTWRNDSNILAKYNESQTKGQYKISSIEKLSVQPPNMEELVGILAGGADIWSAFLIDGYAWSNKKMKNAVIQDWNDYSGGHAVVISGYRDTPSGRQFLIHNSWGESWGEKGYAYVSEAMVNKWLYYAYKVKITNGVKKEDLTDDDCAPDELIDSATGLCAIMCGDEKKPERPNNGCKK